MAEHRNIYKQPEEPPATPAPEPLPEYGLNAQRARARVLRTSLLFAVPMVVLLVWAVLHFQAADHQAQSNELLEKLRTPPPLPSSAATLRAVPAAALAPVIADFNESAPGSPTDSTLSLAPQRMAEAMAEVRTAAACLRGKDWDGAERHARRALEVWPGMNPATRLLGLVYLQRGQFDQSIGVFEKALQSDPFNPETLNNIATAYLQRRMYGKAEEMLLASLQVDPDYPVAHLNLGLLYLLVGRYAQAVDAFEGALPRLADNPSLLNNIAVCHLRMGRCPEARGYLTRLLEKFPDTAETYFNMSISYALETNADEAVAWIRRGAEHCSPTVAQGFMQDGDFDAIRGRPEFRQALQNLYPALPQGPGL